MPAASKQVNDIENKMKNIRDIFKIKYNDVEVNQGEDVEYIKVQTAPRVTVNEPTPNKAYTVVVLDMFDGNAMTSAPYLIWGETGIETIGIEI
ncbi:unnamed protein product [Didymodactylos carnosus]|uniref:Uncharacterized protein n=1 Tax=Didymodactylos carnosus TaxID=1234261 RepID=A0A815HKB6_9BILA|nr:unnamed protein product [Didymodactylos carnosus]CAF1353743.1 unnamed protein product [Didymodactylos carnosus]CAF3978002.1 unnamed protein product [Didymodactylos carnosus]CAF4226031.1 unnamed protein product [Didymodactylos carnosus]